MTTLAIRERGYVPIHVFPGRTFFRQGAWMAETFIIYRRTF